MNTLSKIIVLLALGINLPQAAAQSLGGSGSGGYGLGPREQARAARQTRGAEARRIAEINKTAKDLRRYGAVPRRSSGPGWKSVDVTRRDGTKVHRGISWERTGTRTNGSSRTLVRRSTRGPKGWMEREKTTFVDRTAGRRSTQIDVIHTVGKKGGPLTKRLTRGLFDTDLDNRVRVTSTKKSLDPHKLYLTPRR